MLGGDIAASRPICDAGWLPLDRQIGSSGQTIAPKLYIALGISGAIQHIVGMKGSRMIIAINKDAEAPIFEIADIGVVANLFDMVPPLIEEIKKAKAGVCRHEETLAANLDATHSRLCSALSSDVVWAAPHLIVQSCCHHPLGWRNPFFCRLRGIHIIPHRKNVYPTPMVGGFRDR